MDGLSLDQLRVFLAISDQGSFSAAARSLHRAQSAITYSINKLEDQIGTPLFDRTDYRPVLTEAGRALLPRVRRILEEVNAFRLQARGIAGGVEAELALAIDSMFPIQGLLETLRAFRDQFPSVQLRIFIESLGGTVRLLTDEICQLGILTDFAVDTVTLKRIPLMPVELVFVASPDHPLAQYDGPIAVELLRDHVQLVLTDRSGLTANREYNVYSPQTWRIADLGAKHMMLRANLGYGSMPLHMVEEDLQANRLVRFDLMEWRGRRTLPMCVATPVNYPIGPAGRWLMERFTGQVEARSYDGGSK